MQMKKSAQSSSTSNSNTPSDSTKLYASPSCSECKQPPSSEEAVPDKAASHLSPVRTALFDGGEGPPPQAESAHIHPAVAAPRAVEHDSVDSVLFALLVMVGGMMVGVALRIAIRVSQQPQLLL